MYKILFLAGFILSFINVDAQQFSSKTLGFSHYTLDNDSLGKINYYVTDKETDQVKPVLLYLDGSGATPLFQHTERGFGSTVVFDFQKLSETYHVVLISKPGVPFIDSVKMDKHSGYPVYEHPEEYKKRLSLEWRVYSAQLVLRQVINDFPVLPEKIAILGISEGFQVGAKLCSIEPLITHVMLFAGNGLNQFYDFIIQTRIEAETGVRTKTDAEAKINYLTETAKEIYANPKATDKEWYGHTYLRWASFTGNNPTENILSADIPVYIAVASDDKNTTVLSTDYLYLESIRKQKNNIIYKVYPYDHSFNEQIKNENGEITSVVNHMDRVIDEALDWLKNN